MIGDEHFRVVFGILTASAATWQLLFLPLLAKITLEMGWRYAIYTAIAVIAVLIPVVAIWMRNHPYDIGAAPYGSDQVLKPAEFKGNLYMTPLLTLRMMPVKTRHSGCLRGRSFSAGSPRMG